MSRTGRRFRAGLSAFVSALILSSAWAGGPWKIDGEQVPMRWPGTAPTVILYNVDAGGLGTGSPGDANAALLASFAEWEFTGLVDFQAGTALPDVDAAGEPAENAAHYLRFWNTAGDAYPLPIIFDEDGSIMDHLFGTGAHRDVLGVANIDTAVVAGPNIADASLIINGVLPVGFTSNGYKSVMVHELGHVLNLDHSVLNFHLAGDGDPGNDVGLPSMFPLVPDAEIALKTLHADDVRALEALYGTPASGGIAGVVRNSTEPIQGAQVIVRDPADPLRKAWSYISGRDYLPGTPPCYDACTFGPDDPGAYSIDGLPPGSYQVCVEQVWSALTFSNGLSVGPLAEPRVLSGPEECHGIVESTDSNAPDWDDPDDAATIVVDGSSVVTGIHIELNDLPTTDLYNGNDSFGAAVTEGILEELAGLGYDTSPALIASVGEVDFYSIPGLADGDRIRVDIDASELGSDLDAVIGLYDAAQALRGAVVDDADDPDTGAFSRDPFLDVTVDATWGGAAFLVVSSYPDLDLDGSGGATTGPYWLRVEVDSDSDGDGVVDRFDVCPAETENDFDYDGLCGSLDNCDSEANPSQTNTDTDSHGDACDNCPTADNEDQANDDGDQLGNICDLCTLDPANDVDGDGVCGNVDTCDTLANPLQDEALVISGTRVLGGDVSDGDVGAGIASTSDRVLFLADATTDGTVELYTVPIEGGTRSKVNGTLATAAGVQEFAPSADATRVVYRASETTPTIGLYQRAIDGTGSITRLDPAGPDVLDFQITPDSARVVFRKLAPGPRIALYTAPIDGPAPATPINPVGSVAAFRLNSTDLVWLNDLGELRHVAVDGTGAKTPINPGHTGAAEDGFLISPDGTRVVFRSDASTPVELYSVPIAGGTQTRLDTTTTGAVQEFLLAPDGLTVVYRAHLTATGPSELYSVPVTGGTPTKLNGILAAGASVLPDFDVLPDGSAVVYRADHAPPGNVELHAVPIGGGSVTTLNDTLVTNGDVTAFEISPDSAVVGYRADQDVDEQFELYAVPSGGGTATRLNDALDTDEDVEAFALATGGVALYRADEETEGVAELFSVPLGGGDSRKLHAAPVSGGEVVGGFAPSGDGMWAVFRGDLDDDEEFELWSQTLAPDRDGDGILDPCDNCEYDDNNGQGDTDGDGVGDSCDPCPLDAPDDPDGDGACENTDNCPGLSNLTQLDSDFDGRGDECDVCAFDADDDPDLDGVCENSDNCPGVPNADQADDDDDGTGDACELDTPTVDLVLPSDGAIDVDVSSVVILYMTKPIDEDTVNGHSVILEIAGVKVETEVSLFDERLIQIDPLNALEEGADYTVRLLDDVTDLLGNPATEHTSTFDTLGGPGEVSTDGIGTDAFGSITDGDLTGDDTGQSVAVLDDVNGDGLADVLYGSPFDGFSDAGKATLILVGTGKEIDFLGASTNQRAGMFVASAGNIDDDPLDLCDFAIAAPEPLSPISESRVYVIFGHEDMATLWPSSVDLGMVGAGCSGATPWLCGIVFTAPVADRAGASVSPAGDINDDGVDDLLIGAPDADPPGGTDAGAVYLIHGGVSAGEEPLSGVGSLSSGAAVSGLVFQGEAGGDNAGESVSLWPDDATGIDDLIIGAPRAKPEGYDASSAGECGFVYAIHDGTQPLGAEADAFGVIDLSRVANGDTGGTEVSGVVYLGTEVGGEVGRSTTGGFDVNGDGTPDVIFASDGTVIVIADDGPKTTTVSTNSDDSRELSGGGTKFGRGLGRTHMEYLFETTRFTEREGEDLGLLNVAGAGDVNDDGIDDFLVGAPDAAPEGRVFLIYGSATGWDTEVFLGDVGVTVPGIQIVAPDDGDPNLLGTALSGGADVTGDGIDDVVLGAPGAGPETAGRVYVLSPLAPDEVLDLTLERISATQVRLNWKPAARATRYRVYKDDLDALASQGGVVPVLEACPYPSNDVNENGDPDFDDFEVTNPGDAVYYLVTASNLHGEGPLGPAGQAPPRVLEPQPACP